jgi:hypothetical protein
MNQCGYGNMDGETYISINIKAAPYIHINLIDVSHPLDDTGGVWWW